MKRAYSVANVMTAKIEALPFDGEWKEAVGRPELGGSWIIYGAPKNGKTTLALQLSKYLTKFGRVAYDSVEEGLSLSLKVALDRVGMGEASGRFTVLDKEGVDELEERLKRQHSAKVVVIDSVQFLELRFEEYKRLKERFPGKLFIYVSHVDGNQPEGRVAKRIWRDANVAIRVEGFRGFPVGRYGGGKAIDVNEELAKRYWDMPH